MRFNEIEALSAGYLLPPAAYNADNAPATFDIGTADACSVMLQVGVGGITFSTSNKVEFVLSHSDEASANFTPVAQADVEGVVVAAGGIVRALTAAHAAPSVTPIAYVGGKRYLRLLADFSGTHGTATPLSALAVRQRLLSVAP